MRRAAQAGVSLNSKSYTAIVVEAQRSVDQSLLRRKKPPCMIIIIIIAVDHQCEVRLVNGTRAKLLREFPCQGFCTREDQNAGSSLV
jgi:hypothetical protein